MSDPVPHAGASPEARPPQAEECEGCRRGLPINSHGRHWYRTASLANGVVELPHTPAPVSARVPLTCEKVQHVGGEYLHGADDDGPYDVDGVAYCGRCHIALPHSGPLSVAKIANLRARVEDEESVVSEWEWLELFDSHESLRTALASARSALGDEIKFRRDARRAHLAKEAALQSALDAKDAQFQMEQMLHQQTVTMWVARLARLAEAMRVDDLFTGEQIIEEAIKRSAALDEAKRREEALRGVANEMLSAICSGRLASIGSIDNTFLPQISADRVRRWQSQSSASPVQSSQSNG